MGRGLNGNLFKPPSRVKQKVREAFAGKQVQNAPYITRNLGSGPTALVDLGAGLMPLVSPSRMAWLLLGVDRPGSEAVVAGRICGVALFAIGIACRVAWSLGIFVTLPAAERRLYNFPGRPMAGGATRYVASG